MDTFPTTPQPSMTSAAKRAPRILETQYGGGYRQSLADGPNNDLRVFSLVWTGRSWTELLTIDTFLDAEGGWQTFQWLSPEPFNQTLLVKCKDWGWTWDGGQVIGLTATFEEVIGTPATIVLPDMTNLFSHSLVISGGNVGLDRIFMPYAFTLPGGPASFIGHPVITKVASGDPNIEVLSIDTPSATGYFVNLSAPAVSGQKITGSFIP